MKTRRLGSSSLTVGAIGMGCMGLSIAYDPGTHDEASSIALIRRAIDLGVTLFDTSDAYGPFDNEVLVGRAVRGRRDQVVIATKAGCAPNTESFVPKPDGRPEVLKQCCDDSLRRLGVDVIDLWQLHRPDPNVPIEESTGAMGDMVRAGKVRAIGMSELTLEQLQAAHRTFPLASLQSELSLWTRDVLGEILPWCEANDIAFIPFAPLGRGYLTGAIAPDRVFADKDVRMVNPRFTTAARRSNQPIVDDIRAVAATVGATSAQVALAWILAQGDQVIPIPGSDRIDYLDENVRAAEIVLAPAALERLAAIAPPVGSRY